MKPSRGRARFGILVPFTDTNLEPDMEPLAPDGVSMHFARMGGHDQDEVPDANQMHGLGAADLDEPLCLLLRVRPDVTLYGCTSATHTHGPTFDQSLAERIKAVSGAETFTAAGALVNVLRTLGANRIGFTAPYVSGINDMAVTFLTKTGFDTVARSEVDDALDNYGQGALDPQAVYELDLAAAHPDAEVVVLSCTDMRSVETIARLERALDKPVISSNQAMMFHAMRAIGVDAKLTGYGQLLEGVGT